MEDMQTMIMQTMSLTMNDTVTVVMVALGMVVLGLLYLRGPPTVGVEFEVIRKDRFSPMSVLAQYIGKMTGRSECEYVGYTHDGVDNLKIVSDGSLSGGGVEVVSPVMPVDSRGLIGRLCDAFRGIFTTDGSCGLHWHNGVIPRNQHEKGFGPTWDRDDSNWSTLNGWLGRILVGYGYFESAIDGLLSPSRRGSQGVHGGDSVSGLMSRLESSLNYRDMVPERGIKWSHMHALPSPFEVYQATVRTACENDWRYFKVNLCSVHKYGTVEFRQHQGSINPVQINAWGDLLVALTTACRMPWNNHGSRDPTAYPPTFEGMLAWLGIRPDSGMATTLKRRQSRFNGTLTADEVCSECGRRDCDRDEYCPTAAGGPTNNAEYMAELEAHQESEAIANDDNCGYCGEDDWGCECGSVSLMGLLGMWMVMLAPFVLIVGCGIGAYHAVGRTFGMKKNLKSLKRLFTGLTSRGKAAAGFALRSLSGRNPNNGKPVKDAAVWVLKDSVSAHLLAPRMNHLLDPETQLVLLHTRYPTDGANVKRNAHPHRDPQNKGYTVVHNGMVFDHEKVFKALGVKPETECDSEAIAACLADGGIESVVKHCYGSMALLWTDDSEAGVLNAWRNEGNPLHFCRLDDANGPVVFGSTEAHLKKAFKKRCQTIHSCKVGRHYKVHPDGAITHDDIADSDLTYYTYVRTTSYHGGGYMGGVDGRWDTDYDDFGLADYYRKKDDTPESEKHTYDSDNHQGVRPDGTTYDLPVNVDPVMDQLDMIDLESGSWDPENRNAHNLYGDSYQFV